MKEYVELQYAFLNLFICTPILSIAIWYFTWSLRDSYRGIRDAIKNPKRRSSSISPEQELADQINEDAYRRETFFRIFWDK